MIKRYCDRCEAKITRNAVSNRIAGKSEGFQVEVIAGTGSTWNQGDLCVPCVVTLVHEVASLIRAETKER